MEEVAEPAPGAGPLVKVPTPGLPEVCDGTEFDLHGPAVVVSAVHHLESVTGVLLVEELAVDVTDHVITQIVAHVQLVDSPKFGQLKEEVLEETKLNPRIERTERKERNKTDIPTW